MVEKIKAFINTMNQYGIPLPLLRDNKVGRGSITYTLFVISGVLVVIGLIGKISKQLDIDLSQAIYFFGTCGAMYLGRQLQGDGKNISVGNNITTNNESGGNNGS